MIHLELLAIGPEVLVLWSAGHQGTAFVRADLAYGPVENLNAVEKVDDMHGEPIIEFLVIWLLHARFQIDSRLTKTYSCYRHSNSNKLKGLAY